MRLATRMSLKATHGESPALRPRLPSRESKVPSKAARQGSWKIPVGENLEATVGPQLGLAMVLGRPVNADNCRLSSTPVTMLKGLPEANSIRGASVQLLKNLLVKPSPASLPLWYTPLKTKRCRWSNVEVERSELGK